MYPNIAYLLADLFDYPINGVAAKIPTLGLCLLLSLLYTVVQIIHTTKLCNYNVNAHKLLLAVIFIIVFSYVGSFIYVSCENMFFTHEIKTIFALNSTGALVGCTLGGYFYSKLLGWNYLKLLNLTAPYMLIGYAIARLGCHLSGDGDWGIENNTPIPSWWLFPNWLWAFNYPHNILNQGMLIPNCYGMYCRQLQNSVIPIAIYEVVICFSTYFIVKFKYKINFKKLIIIMLAMRFGIDFLRDIRKIEIFNLHFSFFHIIIILFSIIFFLCKYFKIKP